MALQNGMPVYNFCVAVDDATMGITHVLRAEEHLPNTLRQALVYDALKFPRPIFGHMSLILAPDRSKLSKRHGRGVFENKRSTDSASHPPPPCVCISTDHEGKSCGSALTLRVSRAGLSDLGPSACSQ